MKFLKLTIKRRYWETQPIETEISMPVFGEQWTLTVWCKTVYLIFLPLAVFAFVMAAIPAFFIREWAK